MAGQPPLSPQQLPATPPGARLAGQQLRGLRRKPRHKKAKKLVQGSQLRHPLSQDPTPEAHALELHNSERWQQGATEGYRAQ